ncbi:hypothetical protein H2O64_19370 [Kordia sp. YSTF-M3]|uniref:Uncharacterized protein n=1 Tax=Kordia aestuariivivens TaxID=2759037 RepID=A0ABR7QED8_9FLAO|nr:hypothetical protein [Kordia aestuariivivens]MBC8756843.1 hypothetical protein [Kordia aestuariivivens]
MKKRTLKKLTFHKNVISSFNPETIKGGGWTSSLFYPPGAYGCHFACKIPTGD